MSNNHVNESPANGTDSFSRWQEPLEQAGLDPEQIRQTASDYLEKTTDMIRQRPLEAVGIAVGLGLLAGLAVKQTFSRS